MARKLFVRKAYGSEDIVACKEEDVETLPQYTKERYPAAIVYTPITLAKARRRSHFDKVQTWDKARKCFEFKDWPKSK